MSATWCKALENLEIATARLESAVPDDLSMAEEALALREEAVRQIAALPARPGVADGLRQLLERGEEAARRLRLVRAQSTVELGNVEQQRLLLRALGRPESADNRVGYSG